MIEMGDVVSFRIDSELKKQLDQLKDLNWSHILRSYLKQRVQEELSRRNIDFVRRAKAMEDLDTLREKISEDDNWNSTEELRRWREYRK